MVPRDNLTTLFSPHAAALADKSQNRKHHLFVAWYHRFPLSIKFYNFDPKFKRKTIRRGIFVIGEADKQGKGTYMQYVTAARSEIQRSI